MATKKAATPTPAPTPAPASAPANTAAPAEKPAKEVDPNAITLAEICKELGIAGTVARRKLRAKKVQKDGRWVWQKGSKELEEVRKLLSEKPEPKPEAAAATKQ